MSNIAYRIRRGDFRRFGLGAVTIFESPRGQAPFPDDDAMRDADELGIGEFDAWTGVAIVEQHIDAGGVELLIQRIRRLLNARRLLVIDRHQHDLERGDRFRPENAVGVVILFYGRGDDPCDADSVTAHVHSQRLTLLIEDTGVHGGAVQLAELEDMADLDAACDLQGSTAGGAGITALRIADIGGLRFREVASPIHATEVHVFLVGPAYEIRQVRCGVVDIDLAGKTDGSYEAGLRAGGFAHPIGARHP